MIGTNLMTRGFDFVDWIPVIINYDLPSNYETKEIDFEAYLRRISTTCRFGTSGIVFNRVDSARTYQMIQLLEQLFGKKIEQLNSQELDEIERIAL